MKIEKLLKAASALAEPYCITKGQKFRLKDFDPADTGALKNKDLAKELLAATTERMIEMQERLYAQDQWALLIVLQGLDAAGKDGIVKHVMSGVNPQGCDVWPFKTPSREELDHDFLWRTHKCVPERGKIGIFNRSYYEEVLVTRVHPKLLQSANIPDRLMPKHIWEDRFEDINAHERYLSRNGVVIRKFFLHLSKAEQKKRFLERLDDSRKNWKFSMADVEERGYWRDYQEACEDMIQNTSSKHSPWYVVPADNKWFTRLVVASAVVETLHSLDLAFPDADKAKRKELKKVRQSLLHEKK
jgi:PPK2 family polyphosphate:nucleotide phosphotransferase